MKITKIVLSIILVIIGIVYGVNYYQKKTNDQSNISETTKEIVTITGKIEEKESNYYLDNYQLEYENDLSSYENKYVRIEGEKNNNKIIVQQIFEVEETNIELPKPNIFLKGKISKGNQNDDSYKYNINGIEYELDIDLGELTTDHIYIEGIKQQNNRIEVLKVKPLYEVENKLTYKEEKNNYYIYTTNGEEYWSKQKITNEKGYYYIDYVEGSNQPVNILIIE